VQTELVAIAHLWHLVYMSSNAPARFPIELPPLPTGWALTAHFVVPLGIILEFSRAGLFGPRFTVMAATLEEAIRRGIDRIRTYNDPNYR
jgi:hypothetical protein